MKRIFALVAAGIAAWGLLAETGAPVRDFAIVACGARTDAAPAANARAVQKALDAAAQAGGGRVVVPKGVWNCGTIWLRSHVELHLEEGAVLKASADLADYNAPDAYPQNWGCPSEGWNARHFIIAHEVEDVALTGPGTVDGNGEELFETEISIPKWSNIAWTKGVRGPKDKQNLRPGQLVVFIESRNLRVADLTIRHSPCWSLYFYGCDDVTVSDYTVRNGPCDLNTDGIDIDCCRNVTLVRADIETGDDGIAIRASQRHLRGGKEKACEHIRVSDCRLHAYAMGIRIGVGEGLIRDVEIARTTIRRGAYGVAFDCWYGKKERNGVDVEDVRLRDCTIEDCYANGRFRMGGAKQLFGIRRISIENCRFHGQKFWNDDYASARRPEQVVFTHCTWAPLARGDYHEIVAKESRKDAP